MKTYLLTPKVAFRDGIHSRVENTRHYVAIVVVKYNRLLDKLETEINSVRKKAELIMQAKKEDYRVLKVHSTQPLTLELANNWIMSLADTKQKHGDIIKSYEKLA